APGFGPEQRWTSFSVAKSVTSVLLGIALRRGDIHSMHDTLDTYISQLRGTAYAKVTVEQLLTMTSGVRWNEDYVDPHSDVAQMYRSKCENGQPHVISYLAKLPRAYPAGTHWNYNTAETDLLGILVQRATGQSLASYLSQTIWKPYGMATDAYWLKDECDGSDTGGSGLSATLADYARIGQFMLDGGRVDGKPVIADAWMRGALRHQQDVDDPGRGYGYLWWTDADGSYAAIGIFGQLVYVDPARQLVIVQVGAWPQATSKALMASREAFVAAVKRKLRLEAGLLQTLRHSARHVTAAGQLVRAAGVVEKSSAATQHPRELAVERLRVQLAGDAETRRVVQQRVDRGVGDLRDRRQRVGMLQVQPATAGVGIRRPRIERAQPQHIGILLERLDARHPGLQATRGEIAETAAGIEHQLAAWLHQRHLASRVLDRRFLRRRQHLDAIDLERGRAPFGRHQLDQRTGEAGHRREPVAVPVINRAVLQTARIRVAVASPTPDIRFDQGSVDRAAEIQRTGPCARIGITRGQQGLGVGTHEQGAGIVRHEMASPGWVTASRRRSGATS